MIINREIIPERSEPISLLLTRAITRFLLVMLCLVNRVLKIFFWKFSWLCSSWLKIISEIPMPNRITNPNFSERKEMNRRIKNIWKRWLMIFENSILRDRFQEFWFLSPFSSPRASLKMFTLLVLWRKIVPFAAKVKKINAKINQAILPSPVLFRITISEKIFAIPSSRHETTDAATVKNKKFILFFLDGNRFFSETARLFVKYFN